VNDLRAGLRTDEVSAALSPGGLWQDLRFFEALESSNDVVARAAGTASEGLVVVAEEQLAGRGRLGRSWTSPARAGLTLSLLLRPAVPSVRLGLVPLLAGLSVLDVVRGPAGVPASLKWPNDVLSADGRKLAGILVEVVAGAVVVGVGLNVTTSPAELPAQGTSLLACGAGCTDRTRLLSALLGAVESRYLAWRAAAGAPELVLEPYRRACSTIGAAVRVVLPGGGELCGVAEEVGDDGSLAVRPDSGELVRLSSGEVLHLQAGS
jgi:BirA family biotin operon repressor/biotin-[acetyl-CoA-carboxylase] ligase